jgi:hypothetical protein
MLTGLAATTLSAAQSGSSNASSSSKPVYLELKTWYLHNTAEKQGERLEAYLEKGYGPALSRAGAKLDGAFDVSIGPDSPAYVTLAEFPSLGGFESALDALAADSAHRSALDQLNQGSGLPFVRVESSLLRSFSSFPKPAVSAAEGHGRVFELRRYESQSFPALTRKVGMFNNGEAAIFERLGFRPVFFGETIAGPRQPNLIYMLSFDSLAARDKLWGAFGSDPEWKKLSSTPGLSDPEIVANISNYILSPLAFSPVR